MYAAFAVRVDFWVYDSDCARYLSRANTAKLTHTQPLFYDLFAALQHTDFITIITAAAQNINLYIIIFYHGGVLINMFGAGGRNYQKRADMVIKLLATEHITPGVKITLIISGWTFVYDIVILHPWRWAIKVVRPQGHLISPQTSVNLHALDVTRLVPNCIRAHGF